MRWEVSNVTTTGYDITITLTSDLYNYSQTSHANKTDEFGSGAIEGDYSMGTLIGAESLSTPFGTKQVQHWRNTTVFGDTTIVSDYYIGKNTKMYYKMQSTTTDASDPDMNGTDFMLMSDTNISAIRNGDT